MIGAIADTHAVIWYLCNQVPDLPDRVIAATVVCLGVPLISRDGKIRVSDVDTIW